MKKCIIICCLFLISTYSFFGCSNANFESNTKKIGIYLPCTSPQRWIIEGEAMTSILQHNGYEVSLNYSDKDVDLQISQINKGIENNEDAMIIAAIDPTKISEVLEKASENNIKIIAYDKFIENSDCVNYYISFDSRLTGIMQGNSLIEGLHESGTPPYNVELFAGCDADSNAMYFYNGTMSVLQPLIDSGEINIVSGEIEFTNISLEFQNPNYAAERLERLIDTYYQSTDLDGILSPNDVTSLRIIDFLDSSPDFSQNKYPVITGQDAEIESIIAITKAKQYSTIFKDSKLLSQIAASMVTSVLNDEVPEINHSQFYNNGKNSIPSYLCEPVLITKENYHAVLIDSGQVKHEDVFPDAN